MNNSNINRSDTYSGAERRPITLALSYQPPLGWDELLGFLAGRTIPGIEAVEGGKYLRTFNLLGEDGNYHQGWLSVANQPSTATLLVSVIFAQPDGHNGARKGARGDAEDSAEDGLVAEISFRLRHLFDLDCQPDRVAERLLPMNDLGPGFF